MREIRHYAWHYSPPTRKEFRGLLDRWGVSQEDAARISDTTSRSIRRYMSEADSPVPFAIFYTLASECANVKITKDGWREELNCV